MVELYDRTAIIAKRQPAFSGTDAELILISHAAKWAEESGEVSKDLNTLVGIRELRGEETVESTRVNLAGELGSMLQLIFAVASLTGISYDELETKLEQENKDWSKWVMRKYGK